MLPVTDKERELVREKMIQILTEYLTKQGKPIQHSRLQDLSSKFEQQVYQTSVTRNDYVKAIQEKIKQVYKRTNEGTMFDQQGTSQILSTYHINSPNMLNHNIPSSYPTSSLSPHEYQILNQQITFLEQFLPHSDKIFSSYQTMGGSLSPETFKKLNILRTVLTKQVQEFPSGIYIVHPSRSEKLIEYLKKYTFLLSQKINKIETSSAIPDLLATNETSTFSSLVTTNEQEEVDFIMNVTIFGGTTNRPSTLSNMAIEDQISVISNYVLQQFDFSKNVDSIDQEKESRKTLTFQMNSMRKKIRISDFEKRLIQLNLSSEMNAWMDEICSLLKNDCYITELKDDNKDIILLLSHKNSDNIAKIFLSDIDLYVKRGRKVISWSTSDQKGTDISVTDIAKKLFSI